MGSTELITVMFVRGSNRIVSELPLLRRPGLVSWRSKQPALFLRLLVFCTWILFWSTCLTVYRFYVPFKVVCGARNFLVMVERGRSRLV